MRLHSCAAVGSLLLIIACSESEGTETVAEGGASGASGALPVDSNAGAENGGTAIVGPSGDGTAGDFSGGRTSTHAEGGASGASGALPVEPSAGAENGSAAIVGGSTGDGTAGDSSGGRTSTHAEGGASGGSGALPVEPNAGAENGGAAAAGGWTDGGAAGDSSEAAASADCGNGAIEVGEQCDDVNESDADGCDGRCFVERGWACAGAPSDCARTCGEGHPDLGEACDDGNVVDEDGCSSVCQLEPGFLCRGWPSVCATSCGDGVIAGPEACDDGDRDDDDGCSGICAEEPGFVCTGWPRSSCGTVCGDGVVAGDEACDDGGAVAADGCTSGCSVEFSFRCSGEPSTCVRVCDTLDVAVSDVKPGGAVSGTTSGASRTSPQGSAGCQPALGPEVAYRYLLDHTADLVWTVDADFAAVAHIRADCDGLDDDARQIADTCPPPGVQWSGEQAVQRAAAPGTYYLFVDGRTETDAGAFSANLRVRELQPKDGDCDGDLVGCDWGLGCDPDTGTCEPEGQGDGPSRAGCNDFLDNDGDGLIDCEDPGCQPCPVGASAPGEPCIGSHECRSETNAPVCFDEVESGAPGGYCSSFCEVVGAPCDYSNPMQALGICVSAGLSNGHGLCRPPCTGNASCRVGRQCELIAGVKACMPWCDSTLDCPTAGFCNTDVHRCVTTTEDCSNQVCDDGDGYIDCEDRDCLTACTTSLTATCAAAPGITGDDLGETTAGTQDFRGSCTGWDLARERVYGLTAGAPGSQRILLARLQSAPGAAQGLYIRNDCVDPTSELACLPPAPDGAPLELMLPISNDGGFLFVDGDNGTFRLETWLVPSAESEPNDTASTACSYFDPCNATILPAGDVDVFSFDNPVTSTVNVELQDLGDGGCRNGSIDSQLELLGADGTTLFVNDDIDEAAGQLCSRVRIIALLSGRYYVRVSASPKAAPTSTFAYRLALSIE